MGFELHGGTPKKILNYINEIVFSFCISVSMTFSSHRSSHLCVFGKVNVVSARIQ